MKFLRVVEQKLLRDCVRQTLENGVVRDIPYLIDEAIGEKYCETDPELIKVAAHQQH